MDSSPLLKLPGELKNRIYELALYHPSGIQIRVLTGIPQLVEPPNQHILALSQTCKQTRFETASVLYENNRFTLITKPPGQRYKEDFWKKGLHAWLQLIGERNRNSLAEVEIDIGTSFMYDLYPSSETIWRSVSALMCLFNRTHTRISMKTDVNWMSRSRRTFPVSIPLNDNVLARVMVCEVLKKQRVELEKWSRASFMAARDVGYRRMELETAAQEMMSFVDLLETANAGRLD